MSQDVESLEELLANKFFLSDAEDNNSRSLIRPEMIKGQTGEVKFTIIIIF